MFSGTLNADLRMSMTTDDESGILAGNVFVSVCEAEWAPVKVFFEYDDPGLFVPMILYDIVVSFYQQHLRTGNIPAPTQKKSASLLREL